MSLAQKGRPIIKPKASDEICHVNCDQRDSAFTLCGKRSTDDDCIPELCRHAQCCVCNALQGKPGQFCPNCMGISSD